MCCFSLPIRHVSRTRIFARPTDPTRQLVVYSMRLVADADLAMVLPVPVPASSREDAVRFIDMSSAPTFFDELDTLFPSMEAPAFGAPRAAAQAFVPQPRLVVHEVGDFEASFVPTPGDFARLDPRFRLPSSFWDALPGYRDWGFCVFKLRVGSAAHPPLPVPPPPAPPKQRGFVDKVLEVLGGAPTPASPPMPPPPPPRDFHPMAFEFPRRDPTKLFFPTVHVHDGRVHPQAFFDHALYCQGAHESVLGGEWLPSVGPAGRLAGSATTWLDRDKHVRRWQMVGIHRNEDILVPEEPRPRSMFG